MGKAIEERKVELIMPDGRKVRVMEHQVHDAITKFGASRTKKEVKDIPKELLKIPERQNLLPEMKVDPVKVISEDKPARKAPVRSKSKK